jgi:putative tryptophan/tyrosine transport system substrate-binding protein
MRRRDFIGILGAAAGWSLAAKAQQHAPITIGFLHGQTQQAYASLFTAFREGLSEIGLSRRWERPD